MVMVRNPTKGSGPLVCVICEQMGCSKIGKQSASWLEDHLPHQYERSDLYAS